MDEIEFKRMLGIHKLDHIDFFHKDTQSYLKEMYPNLELNIENKFTNMWSQNQKHVIHLGCEITIEWNGKISKRYVEKITNELFMSMMKELDPL